MERVKKTYRLHAATAQALDSIAEREHLTATEALERCVQAYAAQAADDTHAQGRDRDGAAAILEQLRSKDEQIAVLGDALKAAQETAKAAQALQAATLKRLGDPSRATESRLARLKRAWRGEGAE